MQEIALPAVNSALFAYLDVPANVTYNGTRVTVVPALRPIHETDHYDAGLSAEVEGALDSAFPRSA